MKVPFLGGAYKALSDNLACQRLVNLYPEMVSEGGSDVGAFFGCPGLDLVTVIGGGPIRAIVPFFDVALAVVSGNILYSVTKDFLATPVGNIPGTGPVTVAVSPDSVVVVAENRMFQYDVFVNTFFEVVTGFPGAGTVDFQGGFFIFNQPDTETFWIYDGSGTVDPLEDASADVQADNIVRIFVDHQEVWIFGTSSTEIWQNSGGADFPYTPLNGSTIETGCAAPFSPAKLDNSIFWLGSDTRGGGVVYRANGYSPVRVSTHAIELAIQGYADVSDAIGYGYQQDGHSFYVLTFPTGNATWVYDVATGLLHERAYMNPTSGQLGRHLGNCHTFFRATGQHLIGDYRNGNIYAFNLETYTDNGDFIRWVRACRALPPGANDLTRTFQHVLQLYAQAGVGINSGQGSNPQVMLRWSDDGGHTWSNEHWRSLGRIGQTGFRCIWRKLGSTEKLRDRVYEFSGTDPAKRAFVGVKLDLNQGTS